MADYTEAAISAYETIKEAGGPVTIIHPTLEDVPTNPALPWEGSEVAAGETPHFAVFLPLNNSLAGRDANPFAESALIPAHNLPFPIEKGVNLRKADGTIVSVVNVIALDPAGDSPILYTCEVNTWPGI